VNKPTKATNYGAQLTVESITRKIKRMLTLCESEYGDPTMFEDLLTWIQKRSQRTAKRPGGVGKK
jgi:hypothetical protein